ncbi:TetR/AcrR family transcriptional regulator [Novosphingobium sp. PhB165]|uniref:TetR/AcrR family transcriptional regulator n=1 Tax=Novosphingobium sp. PhB165 TaxID=2485105 RepID=UPI00104C9701|nr:TetR/AcrR family transcriptional regulator [Novosphingobium sp. PhB165]
MTMSNRHRNREDAAARRALIVGEAIRMIGQGGLRGFTIQGLARRCGLSNAGLLYYFQSKDDLLLALMGEIEQGEEIAIEPLLAAIERSSSNDERAYEEAVRLLRVMAERLSDAPQLTRFITIFQTDAMSSGHSAHGWFIDRANEAEDLFAKLFAPWAAIPELSARLILALMQGLTRRWLEDGRFDLPAQFEMGVRALVPFAPQRSP